MIRGTDHFLLIHEKVWWEITSHSDYSAINFHMCILYSMTQGHGAREIYNMNKHGFIQLVVVV